MGLKVNYIIKRRRGKMTYRILDIFYQNGIKYFLLENKENGKVYHTKAEDNWEYYGRVYDTMKPIRKILKFKFDK
jgi:hypothetical protein